MTEKNDFMKDLLTKFADGIKLDLHVNVDGTAAAVTVVGLGMCLTVAYIANLYINHKKEEETPAAVDHEKIPKLAKAA